MNFVGKKLCCFIARSNPSFNIVPERKMTITQFVNTVIPKVYLDLHACLFIAYILTYVLNSYDIQWVLLKTSKDAKEAVRCKWMLVCHRTFQHCCR